MCTCLRTIITFTTSNCMTGVCIHIYMTGVYYYLLCTSVVLPYKCVANAHFVSPIRDLRIEFRLLEAANCSIHIRLQRLHALAYNVRSLPALHSSNAHTDTVLVYIHLF
jgi:hypothetical protein